MAFESQAIEVPFDPVERLFWSESRRSASRTAISEDVATRSGVILMWFGGIGARRRSHDVEVRVMVQSACFGGGCHWCTEAVFPSLRDVGDLNEGFIASKSPNDSFSEAVAVTWEPAAITFADLIAVHLATLFSASRRKMRGKYRNAVNGHETTDGEAARRIIDMGHLRQAGVIARMASGV